MKAIILAAGKGERLRGYVKKMPKSMIQLKGRPIIEHIVLLLRKNGIKDIYINLHFLPGIIRDHLKDGSHLKVRITYSTETKLLGTAGAVRKIADRYWHRDTFRDFIVLYGDNYITYDLKYLIAYHRKKRGMATIGLYRKKDARQSGIAMISRDKAVKNFIEKPDVKASEVYLVNTGAYVMSQTVLDHIPRRKFSDFGRDIFPALIRSGKKIYGCVLKGKLIAVDTPELLSKLKRQRRFP